MIAASPSWLMRFETVCAMYQCRPIETVATNVRDRTTIGVNNDLFVGGPGGFWLSEVTSVEFDEHGALLPTCHNALLRLAQLAVLNDAPARVVAIDWFIVHTTPYHGARRQCLVRIDANNRAVFVTLLANSVCNAFLVPAGLAYSRYPDRLRPFTIMLICEILERDVSVEVLNMHGEQFISSKRWLNRPRLEHGRRDEATTRHLASTDSSPDVNGDLASTDSHPGWLELIRDAHTRGRWIRVIGYANATVNSIVSECALSGSMRYAWRNRRPMRAGSRVNECPVGWLLPLRTIEFEMSCERPSLLPLCDFDVWTRRTKNLLLNISTCSTRKPSLRWIRTIPLLRDEAEYDVIDDNGPSWPRSSKDPNDKDLNDFKDDNSRHDIGWNGGKYSSPAAETLREKRYFVRADGRLSSARFITLS